MIHLDMDVTSKQHEGVAKFFTSFASFFLGHKELFRITDFPLMGQLSMPPEEKPSASGDA